MTSQRFFSQVACGVLSTEGGSKVSQVRATVASCRLLLSAIHEPGGVSFQSLCVASSVHVPRLARSEASYFAGIFARLRAMASSTAFSCFSSSSRRDSVLLGFVEPEPGTGGLPEGAAGPFPDDLGGGDRGRFLSKKKSKKCCQVNGEQVTWYEHQISRHTCLPGGAQAGVLVLVADPSEETAGIEEASAFLGLKKKKEKKEC